VGGNSLAVRTCGGQNTNTKVQELIAQRISNDIVASTGRLEEN
jgi:hypothetical protein